MSKKSDIVLSVSAVAAALSALSQATHTEGQPRIAVFGSQTEHQTAIDAAMTNTAIQAQLRNTMATMLPAMDVDKETLHTEWIRLASMDLLNPNLDSTLRATPEGAGISVCYNNCHAACHGSRGWR